MAVRSHDWVTARPVDHGGSALRTIGRRLPPGGLPISRSDHPPPTPVQRRRRTLTGLVGAAASCLAGGLAGSRLLLVLGLVFALLSAAFIVHLRRLVVAASAGAPSSGRDAVEAALPEAHQRRPGGAATLRRVRSAAPQPDVPHPDAPYPDAPYPDAAHPGTTRWQPAFGSPLFDQDEPSVAPHHDGAYGDHGAAPFDQPPLSQAPLNQSVFNQSVFTQAVPGRSTAVPPLVQRRRMAAALARPEVGGPEWTPVPVPPPVYLGLPAAPAPRRTPSASPRSTSPAATPSGVSPDPGAARRPGLQDHDRRQVPGGW